MFIYRYGYFGFFILNFYICVITASFFLGMCSHSSSYVNLSERMIEYQLDGGQYAIVVVMDGVSVKKAKQIARQRAAQITALQGDRYFTIDSEEQTEVIKPNQGFENQRFYGNMYQELIIEGDFGRNQINRQPPISRMYPAIRLVFTPYLKRPSQNAIDACKLTDCN